MVYASKSQLRSPHSHKMIKPQGLMRNLYKFVGVKKNNAMLGTTAWPYFDLISTKGSGSPSVLGMIGLPGLFRFDARKGSRGAQATVGFRLEGTVHNGSVGVVEMGGECE